MPDAETPPVRRPPILWAATVLSQDLPGEQPSHCRKVRHGFAEMESSALRRQPTVRRVQASSFERRPASPRGATVLVHDRRRSTTSCMP
jgi:hypothetical protein